MAHILPKKKKSITETSNAVEGNVYCVQGTNPNTNSSGNSNNSIGYNNNHGKSHNFRGRGGHGGYNSGNNNYGNNNNSNNNSNYNNSGNQSGNKSNNDKSSNFDASKFCIYHGGASHSTEDCRASFKDENYLNWLQAQGQGPPNQQSQQNPQPNPPSYHRANIVARALRTSIDNYIWVYDSCCTDDMTGDKRNFHSFEEFTSPSPVYGVGKSVIHAYGKGQIILESTNDYSTHSLPQVWYVPGIQESILSAFSTRFNNLKTTVDDNENFILTSKVPGSSFSATTAYTNKMAILPTIRTLRPTTAFATTTVPPSNSPPGSFNPRLGF